MLECSPSDISGMSSSITTYIMAPAAKAKRYGSTGTISPDKSMVSKPATGSTIPDRTPKAKALGLLRPLVCSGMEMMAPSGKF